MMDIWQTIAGNVSAVIMAAAFLWYLVRRDQQIEAAFRATTQMHIDALLMLGQVTEAVNRLDATMARQADACGRAMSEDDN